ncbi:MAG TPA: glyoxalase superfamily protein, partial [Candidatus Sulfotelmatobacter sp.]
MSPTTTPAQIAFGGVTPVLRVRDAAASRNYYVNALGFKVNFETEDFVSVSRGRCALFLCEGDQGNPGSWVWIDGHDVDA